MIYSGGKMVFHRILIHDRSFLAGLFQNKVLYILAPKQLKISTSWKVVDNACCGAKLQSKRGAQGWNPA